MYPGRMRGEFDLVRLEPFSVVQSGSKQRSLGLNCAKLL
jgi:hypothetical protein